jgi:polysaccharide transporter, PST family
MPEEREVGPAARDHLRTDHLHSDLKGRAIRGGTITLASQGLKVAVQIITIVVLARLLAPEDFGLFAMVAAFLVILELFKDLGLSTATVQRPTITHRQVSTLFWLNVALGGTIAAAFAAAAPVLAWFYGETILLEITPVLALALALSGLAGQHLALLRRQMRFLPLAIVQNSADILALSAAIGAALLGFGLWSLVIQRLVWSLAMVVGAWSACGWRPGRPGRFAEVRSMVVFGGNATAAMVLGRLASNLDKILLGWYWGALTLGFYERAQKLLLAPVQNLNAPLAMVALSALSRMRDQPESYRNAYVAAAERLAMLVAPLAALMIASAEPVVLLVLGPQWADAAPILAWMGLSAVYMPLTYTLSWLYLSQDRTPEMLFAALVSAVMTTLVIVAALPFGAVGIAAAYAISGVLVRVPVLLWLAGRRGPVGMRAFGRVIALPAAAVLVASGLLFLVRNASPLADMPQGGAAALLAAVAGVSCLCVYATVPRGRHIILHTLRLPGTVLKREASA